MKGALERRLLDLPISFRFNPNRAIEDKIVIIKADIFLFIWNHANRAYLSYHLYNVRQYLRSNVTNRHDYLIIKI